MIRLNDEQRSFYRNVVTLVLPIAIQNLINVGVTSADVIMLGQVGEKALSGVSLGGQIQYILTMFFFGITASVTVLAAQYWGKRDIATVQKIMGIALKVAVAISLIFTAAVRLAPELVMSIYSNDPEVIRQGAVYLSIVCVTYPIMAVTTTYLHTLRSVEQVKVGTIVYFLSLFINIGCNAVFIFGLFGCPAMGAAGAAWGTVVARTSELVMVIIYDRKLNPVFRFKLSTLKTNSPLLVKDFIHYAIPITLNQMGWGVGSSMATAIMGHMGSAVTSANAVAQVAKSLAQVVNFGISSATGIVVGKAIGAGEEQKAELYAKRFIRLCLIFGGAGAVVVLAVIPLAHMGLNFSPEAKELITMMLCVLSYTVIAQSFNSTVVCGILRSGGDARFTLMVDLVSQWCVCIILGWLAAYVFCWPTTVVYMILMGDEVIKIPVIYARYRSRIWLKNLTRDEL